MNSVVTLAKEYLEMGVPVVWVIHPVGRQAFTVAPLTGLYENTERVAFSRGSAPQPEQDF
jgi:hypothetical protein